MKSPAEITTLEILGIAIQSETEAVKYYQKIKTAVRSIFIKDKLKFLIGEERKHQRILTDYYHRKFPGIKLSKPSTSLVPKPIVPHKSKIMVSFLLKAAMKAEQETEEFYLSMARRINDVPCSFLLKHLAKVENSHYFLLKNELDLIVQGNEMKEMKILYQADEAVHFGP
ncbi:MAG: ferritin family protein [Planctomycetota bacterium]